MDRDLVTDVLVERIVLTNMFQYGEGYEWGSTHSKVRSDPLTNNFSTSDTSMKILATLIWFSCMHANLKQRCFEHSLSCSIC